MQAEDENIRDTAFRTGREQIEIVVGVFKIPHEKPSFIRIGKQFWSRSNSESNQCRSALYLLKLPSHPALKITARNETEEGIRLLHIPIVKFCSFIDLFNEWCSHQQEFADGAVQAFQAWKQSPSFKKKFQDCLSNVSTRST